MKLKKNIEILDAQYLAEKNGIDIVGKSLKQLVEELSALPEFSSPVVVTEFAKVDTVEPSILEAVHKANAIISIARQKVEDAKANAKALQEKLEADYKAQKEAAKAAKDEAVKLEAEFLAQNKAEIEKQLSVLKTDLDAKQLAADIANAELKASKEVYTKAAIEAGLMKKTSGNKKSSGGARNNVTTETYVIGETYQMTRPSGTVDCLCKSLVKDVRNGVMRFNFKEVETGKMFNVRAGKIIEAEQIELNIPASTEGLEM